MRKIPETITKAEVDKILKETKKHHHRIAFALGFYNCLRVSEVSNLKKDNIDKGRKLLKIKSSKGQIDRNIPIAPEVIKGLKHIPIGIGDRALQIAIKKQAKKSINKNIHFHLLRHSGATYYHIEKSWDIRKVQQFLGHARLDTTQIYTHVTPKDLMKEMWGE